MIEVVEVVAAFVVAMLRFVSAALLFVVVLVVVVVVLLVPVAASPLRHVSLLHLPLWLLKPIFLS